MAFLLAVTPATEDPVLPAQLSSTAMELMQCASSEDDDGRYVFRARLGEEEEELEEREHAACKRRRVEDVVADRREALVAALPSPTPSSGSERTVSDDGAGAAGAPVAAAREAFPCHFCGREFGSRNAVHGHMRVHQGEDKEKASTGKCRRGGHCRAVAVAFPVSNEELEGGERALRPELAQVAAAVATAYPVPVRDEPSLNQVFDDHHVRAAAPNLAAGAHHDAPAPPQLARPWAQLLPEAPHGGPYRCKYEGCYKEFETHQGLGGHVAGHIIREKLVATAAAAQGGNGDDAGAKPEGKHRCKQCDREFLTGVALGGHMRKHFDRKLIVNRKKQKPPPPLPGQVAAPAPDPAVPAIVAAASPPAQSEQPKVEVAEHGAEPASEPTPTPAAAPAPVPVPAPTNRPRRVRIFGVEVETSADAEEPDV
ncbi:zinc finger protein 219-like [Oryza brachyantha]|uniref:zinc finger protein 219-like n=1 Tax=Oryza brachyantha TaxID=4533 RepID=UPI001ADB5356|nr:zinc finger protein 219-like [Oryza brachyantha]